MTLRNLSSLYRVGFKVQVCTSVCESVSNLGDALLFAFLTNIVHLLFPFQLEMVDLCPENLTTSLLLQIMRVNQNQQSLLVNTLLQQQQRVFSTYLQQNTLLPSSVLDNVYNRNTLSLQLNAQSLLNTTVSHTSSNLNELNMIFSRSHHLFPTFQMLSKLCQKPCNRPVFLLWLVKKLLWKSRWKGSV